MEACSIEACRQRSLTQKSPFFSLTITFVVFCWSEVESLSLVHTESSPVTMTWTPGSMNPWSLLCISALNLRYLWILLGMSVFSCSFAFVELRGSLILWDFGLHLLVAPSLASWHWSFHQNLGKKITKLRHRGEVTFSGVGKNVTTVEGEIFLYVSDKSLNNSDCFQILFWKGTACELKQSWE